MSISEDINPYRPPLASVEADAGSAGGRELAGRGRRFLTLVVDYFGFMVLSGLVGFALAAIGAGAALQAMGRAGNLLFGLAIIAAYYLFFEGLWGRTPGKLLLGTRVTDLRGGSPRFGDLVKRTLARLVPFEALTFFGQTGFHDKVSRTQVVRVR